MSLRTSVVTFGGKWLCNSTTLFLKAFPMKSTQVACWVKGNEATRMLELMWDFFGHEETPGPLFTIYMVPNTPANSCRLM